MEWLPAVPATHKHTSHSMISGLVTTKFYVPLSPLGNACIYASNGDWSDVCMHVYSIALGDR